MKTIMINLCFFILLALGLHYYQGILEIKLQERLQIYADHQMKKEMSLSLKKLQGEGGHQAFAKFMAKRVSREDIFEYLKNRAKTCGFQHITVGFTKPFLEQGYVLERIEFRAQTPRDRFFYCLLYALQNSCPFYVWIEAMELKRELSDREENVVKSLQFHIVHWREP